jgi:UDP-N-acetyl-D-glucosamine dehydrogenase
VESDSVNNLVSLLESGEIRIGIIGLGYVGLPLVREFCEAGLRVTGFDIDAEKVKLLGMGTCYIQSVTSAEVRGMLQNGLFSPTADFQRLRDVDAIIICVPTPLTKNRDPDLTYVEETAKTISRHLRRDQLVVLESTTYPGTTEEVLRPILESSGLLCGRDFFLAYSPEREDPGNREYRTRSIPKVVGGVDEKSTDLARRLYEKVVVRVIPVSSTGVAEACKILENIYRAVNIALVNELKILFDRMGINVWEVIDAASTKPFGFKPFYPGPGLGGHCIPIDPFYLAWKAKEYATPTRFIELAGEINAFMPEYVIRKATEALNDQGHPLRNSRILILGVAYKEDVDDIRESPALELIARLQARGAEVTYHDPFIPKIPAMRHYDLHLDSSDLTEALLTDQDLVLIATAHSRIDYDWVVRHSRVVVDTRNATRRVVEGREKIILA